MSHTPSAGDEPRPLPGRGRRATISQVAERAGVSHQTVSRYLNRNGGLKPATVTVVERAIAELDYRPDAVARSMRTRRSHRLAIMLPELSHGAPVAMLRGAVGVARDAGYATDVIGPEGGQDERRDALLDLVDTTRPEGVLSFAPLQDGGGAGRAGCGGDALRVIRVHLRGGRS